jgi:5-amino-6-(5-phosphoribosylamino)uracil reductase
MNFRQLLPQSRTIDESALLSELRFAERAPAERPYTAANFVVSADGRATFAGRSGALGDEGDKALFHGLRETVDAIMAGTNTMRIERYGRLVSDPERRKRRAERGLSPEPLACVVTRSGELPTDIPLLSDPDAKVLVFAGEGISVDCSAHVQVVRLDPGELTLTTVMRCLRAEHGVRSLLCEGGPTIFASLLREQLVDELFLTLAPKLTGGGHGPAITSGPELPEPKRMRHEWVLERDDSLFLRYALSQRVE